jgi:hypothetical protein
MPLVWTLIGLLAITGCATRDASTPAVGTPVAVTAVADVAGRWAGLGDFPGHRGQDQYIDVTLYGDGRYQANAARTIGLMDAQGSVQLMDGRLQVRGDRGARGTATLLARNGERTLQIEMMASNGGRMTPAS